MNQENIPLVSVYCLTYNHSKYIVKTIESFLMQKTNFDFEIVIGEDCSTDGTREIVFEYEKKYPGKIKIITSSENVGIRQNSLRTKAACRGKYIAFCEGDDYWIDPLKLQKQLDFMENNPDFSICFHNAFIIWDGKGKDPKYFCPQNQKLISTTEDVLKGWFIPTASMFVVKEFLYPLPDWIMNVYNGDWAFQMILSTKGKIGYINEVMSVYRKNEGSLSGSAKERMGFILNKKIELLSNFNVFSSFKFNKQILLKIKDLEKEIKAFNLRKKSKLLYWMYQPKKLFKKLNNITFNDQ